VNDAGVTVTDRSNGAPTVKDAVTVACPDWSATAIPGTDTSARHAAVTMNGVTRRGTFPPLWACGRWLNRPI